MMGRIIQRAEANKPGVNRPGGESARADQQRAQRGRYHYAAIYPNLPNLSILSRPVENSTYLP